jgi:Inovirus Gp2
LVRIDLGFKKYCPLLSGDPSPQAHDYASAKATFNRFTKAMQARSGCFEHLLGYAWKAEIGMERGIHFHTVVFLDGSKVRQDIVYGEWIGQYWVKEITQQEGHYFNCNRDKANYRECGVGMIHHDDIDKRQILTRRVLPYLTKTRGLLKTQFGKQFRSFGRSEIPRDKQGKMGRRRKTNIALKPATTLY